jgi:hypothetical protein
MGEDLRPKPEGLGYLEANARAGTWKQMQEQMRKQIPFGNDKQKLGMTNKMAQTKLEMEQTKLGMANKVGNDKQSWE